MSIFHHILIQYLSVKLIFIFSRATEPTSTKLGRKHPLVKFVQTNGQTFFQVMTKNFNMVRGAFKNPLANSTELGTNYSMAKGFQDCSIEESALFRMEINLKKNKNIVGWDALKIFSIIWSIQPFMKYSWCIMYLQSSGRRRNRVSEFTLMTSS